jgi:hypothetical protein
MDELN